MNSKTCKRCLGKGVILVNSGTGRTEICPRCSSKLNGQITLPHNWEPLSVTVSNASNKTPPAFKEHRSDTVSSLEVLGAAFCL